MNEEEFIREHAMSPQELTDKELWHMTLDEIEAFKKEYRTWRASVKTVREFSRKGKQLNIKF